MASKFHSFFVFMRKLMLRFVLFALLAAGMAVLYCNLVGIPASILRQALAGVNQGGVAIIAERAELRGITHIDLKNVSIYSKHLLGRPMFEAAVITAEIDYGSLLYGKIGVKRVTVIGSVVRLKQAKAGPGSVGEVMKTALAFDATVKNCRVYDMVLEDGDCRVVVSDGHIYLNGIRGNVSKHEIKGTAGGDITYDIARNILLCDLVSNIDPNLVTTLFDDYHLPYVRTLLERFGFSGDAPRVEWDIDTSIQKEGYLHLTGKFRMRNCSYRGVDFMQADGDFALDLENHKFKATLDKLYAVRPEGTANVSFVAWPKEKQLRFDAESSLNPMKTVRMVNILTNFFAEHLTFDGPAIVTADGNLDFGGFHSNTDFKAIIRADSVGIDCLTCDSGAFDLTMHGNAVVLTNIVASAFDGVVSGDIGIKVLPRKDGKGVPLPCSLNLRLLDADFDRFMGCFSSAKAKKEYDGRISCELDVDSLAGDHFMKNMSGRGRLSINDGRVFMLPVFGGLSNFMTKIIPGLGFVLSQNRAKTKFEIKDERVSTDDLAVEGDILSLKGHGSYRMGGDLDFDVQVKLLRGHTLGGKFFRAITWPITKLFEFKVKGPVGEPSWYPTNFSFDLLRKVGIMKKEEEE